eukprot:scaffold25192_cov59-Phaeocystis_antarctica.AAC.1
MAGVPFIDAYVQQACTLHALHALCMYDRVRFACAPPHAHRMHTACAPHAHSMRTACAPHAHRMRTRAHCMHTAQAEPVVDYLTRYSGLHPGDLDPSVSRHHITTMKAAYLQLRQLVDAGCRF